MGNNCCVSYQHNNEISAENFILLTISHIHNSGRTTFKDISNSFRNHFGIDPLDIEGSPLRWITKEAYENYIINFLNETQRNQIPSSYVIESPQKFLFLPYLPTSLQIYIPSYSHNFNLFILMWQIGFVNFPLKEKIYLIKQIILKVNKILTYLTFTNFLMTYLTIFLIQITHQFLSCPEINLNSDNGLVDLIESIYNSSNVEVYHNMLKNQLKSIIIKTKNIYISEKNISNTFLSEIELVSFFEDHPFLLNAQELRENFFEKFDLTSSLDHIARDDMCS